MQDQSNDPQEFWDKLLSGEPERVRAAFASLEEGEKQAVMAHLGRMASEPGWQPEQRASAQAALGILGEPKEPEEPNEPNEPGESKGQRDQDIEPRS
jgi:hypothetical protein